MYKVRILYTDKELLDLAKELAKSLLDHYEIYVDYCPNLSMVIPCGSLTSTEVQKIIQFTQGKHLEFSLWVEVDVIEVILYEKDG